jgi:hypothetical protein
MNSSVKVLFVAVVTAVCVASTSSAWAQRGRGGRGAGAEASGSQTFYDSKEFGIAFAVPPGVVLYTPDAPGRYRAVLTERKIALLVNPLQVEDSITIKYADGMTEADLKNYQAMLETNPPQAKLPGYEKVSLASAKIGKDGAEEAIDYVYKVKQDGADVTLRQIVFVHNGRGFTITCSAARKDFDQANRTWFSTLLKQLEFR